MAKKTFVILTIISSFLLANFVLIYHHCRKHYITAMELKNCSELYCENASTSIASTLQFYQKRAPVQLQSALQPLDVETVEKIVADQVVRKDRLEQQCAIMRKENKGHATKLRYYHQFFIARSYNTVYCYIPKVGTKQWRRIIVNLNGIHPGDEKDLLRKQSPFRLTTLALGEAENVLKETTNFLFIREPFTRILSAYLDKLAGTNTIYQHRFGRLIVQKYRQLPSPESLKTGNDVTFKEFVQFLIDPSTWVKGTDFHWDLYSTLCHVCDIKFDFIGYFENVGIEGVYLLNNILKVHISDLQNITWKPSNTRNLLLKYYSQLEKLEIEKIWNIYRPDFELFGYSFPGPLEPLFSQPSLRPPSS